MELFSPQKIPRLKPNSRSEPVLRTKGDSPLPWDESRWFRAADRGRTWRFTAYCGVYKLGRVRSLLEQKFGRDPASFDSRTDGDSCLFALQVTAEGRPLLDTFALASCVWAVGRLKDSGPDDRAWMDGFEAAEKEEKLRFTERFAVREDDEIGRELNRKPGVHVGRPIQPGELEAEIEHVAKSLGVSTVLRPQEARLAGRQVDEQYKFDADSEVFLNSLFLRDLERVASEAQSNNSAALSRFLLPEQAIHMEERCDVRTSTATLWRNTSPKLVPAGRWPATPTQSLYFSQQFTVNSVLNAFRENSTALFAVNGPPGTGKTTLLRDLIASVVVERAQALAKLERPELAFAGLPDHWKTGDYTRSIFPWREEFLGFEIVVASSNNRAVENVTLEIPAKGAIDGSYLPEIDYFADVATRLLSGRKQKDGEKASEAWALVAARLGNMQNRRSFVNRFWFEDKKSPVPRSRADKGFQRYLQSVKAKRTAWKDAVGSFEAAAKREAIIREGRIAAYEAMEKSTGLSEELTAIRLELRQAMASALTRREEAMNAERVENECNISLDDCRKARRNHRDFKPGLVDALFSRDAYREWREKDRSLAGAIDAGETELAQARVRRGASQRELQDAEEKAAKLMTQVTEQENVLSQQNELMAELRESLGPAFPNKERWSEESEERELSSPWMDEAWNKARTQILIEALHLHRAFIECVPEKVRKNLHGAMDILKGKVPPEVSGKAVESAWATLFFVIPVVSTTFASFDRLFAHCGRESLGWLLIDEAGQATPQSAAGALWRSKRAVLVGDPRQLEPIVSLPFTAQQALRRHFGIAETWLPSRNSAQTLADRVSRFGTWLPSEDPDKPIWVGSPLRVHRRCERPMFDIANQIAYDGQMVYDTQEAPSSLRPSCWIDVKDSGSDDHWIPAEGVELEILLAELFRFGISPESILLVSPFRAVARKLREIGWRYGIAQAGTIHVSQGKESDIVVLVLGGDPGRSRAKDWASGKPNLLNVAVSRAKRRLYVIGNREEWSQYPNFSDTAALLGSEEKLWARGMSGSR